MASLGLMVGGLCSQVAAQTLTYWQESLETLTTNANDPTAILAQLKIEEDYTRTNTARRRSLIRYRSNRSFRSGHFH
jgi:hypothetical protein